jgi:tetratricopeptide (TPR) repeat protein
MTAGSVLAGIAVIAAGLIALWPHHTSISSQLTPYGLDSTNEQANMLCEQALEIIRSDSWNRIGMAYTNFTKAIDLDPNFARPYVGLVEIRLREDVNVPGMPDRTTDELRSIAHRLKKLGPGLPATFVVEAAINWSDGHFREAERCELEAIKADPNYELGHTFYNWLLCCFGRTDEALEQIKISQKLAWSKVIVYRCFGNTYYAQRDYTNAIAWYQQAIELESHHFAAYQGISFCYFAMGDYTNGMLYAEKNDILWGRDQAETHQEYAYGRRAFDQGGIEGHWRAMWQSSKDDTNAFYWQAKVRLHLGDTNGAIELLRKSFKAHEFNDSYDTSVNLLLLHDTWDGLHKNEDFRKLLYDIGYTEVMRPKPDR